MLFEGKRVLVTGGTGSLGQVLVRRLLSGTAGTPEQVVVFSRDEAKQHYMRLSFEQRAVSTDEVIFENFRRRLQFRIGDVRSYADVCAALQGIEVVINAAALKQVPTCEYFPDQAVATNVHGPENIVRVVSRDAGELVLRGAGAGGPATASAILGDLVASLRAVGERHDLLHRAGARELVPAIDVAPLFERLPRHPELPRYARWDESLLDAPASQASLAFAWPGEDALP